MKAEENKEQETPKLSSLYWEKYKHGYATNKEVYK
jgi:hypothetical protein